MLRGWPLLCCRAAFATLTSDKQSREAAEAQAETAKQNAQPDDLIDFHHLVARKVRAQHTHWQVVVVVCVCECTHLHARVHACM